MLHPLGVPASLRCKISSLKPVIPVSLLFGLLLVLASPRAFAQYRGSIQGVVTDQSGAVVPGATLTLTNDATGQKQTSTSNGEGIYNFGALPPGNFTLVVERSGFATKTYNNLQIIPEQNNTLNVQLAVSTAQQTVTVNAAQTPLINTANGSLSATINSNEVQHMPTFGRDVFQLSQFAPGTIGDMSQSGSGGTFSLPGTQGPGGPSSNGGIFATENGPQTLANGNQYENNSISIDGISTVSAVWGGTSIITPTEESVDDVHVLSNAYDAEYGRFSGAQIQVTSKSGTNTPHGSAFFQRWSPGMNAYQRYNGTSFYNTSCTSPTTGLPAACAPAQRGLNRNEQQFNQYGASLGGPLWKNRLFAFFGYEAERSGTIRDTITNWYDTPAFDKLAPSGSIAATYLGFPGAGVSGVQVSQSCSDIGLTENVNCITIPGQGLNIGSPLTSARGTQDQTWSGPFSPGVGGGLNRSVADIAEYSTINPTTITNDQYNGRVDADVTPKDRLSGTVYWIAADQTNYEGPVRPMNLWHHDVTNNAFAGIWNHIFTSGFLNEARANAAGWRWNEISTNPQAPFGLPQAQVQTMGSISQFQYFGAPGPSVYDQWTYTYRDIATWSKGRHTVKFGGELTRLYYLNENTSGARPFFQFFNVWDFLNDAPQLESGTFDPATGTPSAARQDDRENLWGFFIQDDVKASPNLTLNVGLRYSYFGSLYAKEGNMFSAHFGQGNALLTGLTVQRGGNLWTPQKGNFGPELGFAFTPARFNGKFVVRGGFGLNYNQEEIAISANVYGNPGITVAPNFAMSLPSSPNPGIVYSTATNVHSLFGYPPNPNVVATSAHAFGANGLPTTGTTTVTAFDSNLPTTYVEHYSLETEYDLGFRSVLSLGYTGSLSRHTFFHYDENAVASVKGIPLNSVTPNVYVFGNNGHGNYNAMIVSLRHQMSHQFSADAEFNWSKSMDTSSAPYVFQDYPYDPSLSYGRSDFNVGKSLKLFGMWQPVFFHGSHDWAEKIVGGWTFSGIFNIHSGFPWSPVYSTVGNLYCSGCSEYTSLLPAAYLGGAGNDTSNDAYKSGPGVAGHTVNANFPKGGLAYFKAPTYTPGPPNLATGGAMPQRPFVDRNSLTGPGYKDLDATVSKTFGVPKLHEGSGLEIRGDVFNLFNNLNFRPGGTSSGGGISNNITASNFGQATTALGARTVTLQARFHF
ncbi:MAG TPA: carboxypeptidase-like regulatory domain-containing protein [Terracidiphilus sp.]|nr:carboxypeptidase-like regulatory domain-containing protein [Terracidiphilus sp.]